MVGSSILKKLKFKGYKNVITKSREQLDLTNQNKTLSFLQKIKPDVVIIAAAKVGGINANNILRADFLYQNIQIQNNLIHGSHLVNVQKLIFLGSSCIYPKKNKLPIKENDLLTSPLEYTNEPYAIAKIAGLKLCENYNLQYKNNFLCLMPCNLYGPKDNYDLKNSHFFPALIRKIYEAKIKNKKFITLWGNGRSKRELMHVDDLSDAVIYFIKKNIKESYINIGSGFEKSIQDYAKIIMKFLNVNLDIKYNNNMPNGTYRKILDCNLANHYGWNSKISINDGLIDTFEYFLKNYNSK